MTRESMLRFDSAELTEQVLAGLSTRPPDYRS
jgi:hypothetical protein